MHKDNPNTYGSVSRFLHWSMAAGFAFMLFTVAAWSLNEDYYSLLAYHKPVGFILLVLAAVRLLWAALNAARRPPAHIGARLGHLALYGLMLAVPLVAMIRQYGAARGPLDVFGIRVMTGSPEKIEWMAQLGNQWHGLLGWVLYALAAGHIVMAVVHQIKGEKIINRMAGRR